jgi:hypothetical protein
MAKRVQYCTKINHSTNEKLFSLARRDFKYLSELYDIEIIARGSGVNIRITSIESMVMVAGVS